MFKFAKFIVERTQKNFSASSPIANSHTTQVLRSSFDKQVDLINGLYASALDDNQTIYFEAVPEYDRLTMPDPAFIVKPRPYAFKSTSSDDEKVSS